MFCSPRRRAAHDPCLEEDPGPWLLVEWACEPTSKLASWFQSQGHDSLRLCLPEWDMTERGNTELVLGRIRSAVEARQPVLVRMDLHSAHGSASIWPSDRMTSCDE